MLRKKLSGSVEIEAVDREKLIRKLKKAAKRVRAEDALVEAVSLFGSFARSDYTPLSDVDLLIVVAESERPFLQRSEKYSSFFSGIPFDLNVVVYTKEELKALQDEGRPFVLNIMREAVRLA